MALIYVASIEQKVRLFLRQLQNRLAEQSVDPGKPRAGILHAICILWLAGLPCAPHSLTVVKHIY